MTETPAAAPTAVRSEIGRYAIVPEWVLDAAISAQAVRLYAILAGKYADRTGVAFPGRKLLMTDLKVTSVDTVDRALEELREIGAVTVQPRTAENGRLTSNLYTVHQIAAHKRPSTQASAADGRNDAATSPQGSGGDGRTHPTSVTRPTLNQTHEPEEVRAPRRAARPDVVKTPAQELRAKRNEIVALWNAERVRHARRSGPAFERFIDAKALRNLRASAKRTIDGGHEWRDIETALRQHAAVPSANPWYLDEWTRLVANERLERAHEKQQLEDRRAVEEAPLDPNVLEALRVTTDGMRMDSGLARMAAVGAGR